MERKDNILEVDLADAWENFQGSVEWTGEVLLAITLY